VASRSARGYSRPERLVSSLSRLGAVSPDCTYLTHGRGEGSGAVNRWLPGRGLGSASGGAGVLSPVFLAGYRGRLDWIDLYDDWSIAPNINRYYRLLAAIGYRQIRNQMTTASLVTVNSQYMANLVLPTKAVVVPNGVSEALGGVELEGPVHTRLVVLGEFFPGRTDYSLLETLALRPEFKDVVVLGPGDAPQTRELLGRIAGGRDGVTIEEWIEPEDFGRVFGSGTSVLIPHLVSDYTLSQDPLKAYQAMALGVKVICPRLLWPPGIAADFGLLLDHGIDLDAVLGDFLALPGPDQEWRRRFVRRHGWEERAAAVAEVLTS
jgi:hypothetical protein